MRRRLGALYCNCNWVGARGSGGGGVEEVGSGREKLRHEELRSGAVGDQGYEKWETRKGDELLLLLFVLL